MTNELITATKAAGARSSRWRDLGLVGLTALTTYSTP